MQSFQIRSIAVDLLAVTGASLSYKIIRQSIFVFQYLLYVYTGYEILKTHITSKDVSLTVLMIERIFNFIT